MKNSLALKKCLIGLSMLGLMMVLSPAASAQTHTNKLRVGVYDSRAIAVAWANSTEFKEAMQSVETDFKQAKESKNENRVKEISDEMKSRQRRAHEQAFSTGSVAPIMARIKDRLPEIARQADVMLLVSKWELPYQSAEITPVDVTDKLIALFHVSERGLKWSREIQQKPPLALEQLGEHMD